MSEQIASHADVPVSRLYNFGLHTVADGVLRAYSTTRYEGEAVLQEQSGAYLLAPVHRSMLDILLIAKVAHEAADTQLHFIGKDNLWKIPIAGRVFTACGAFALDRTKPLQSDTVDRVGEIVGRQGVICIFPEGTRLRGDHVDPDTVKTGVAQLAMQYGVPIVPAGITGTEKGRRGQFAASIGAPIWVEQQESDIRKIPDRARRNATKTVIRELTAQVYEGMQRAQASAIELAHRPGAPALPRRWRSSGREKLA